MIYSVVPRELEAELFDILTAHYADDPDVMVIVDRRESERRSAASDAAAAAQQRVLRDRRRRRVTGEFAPLEGEQTAAA
jgi:hypothetical protein